jgi:diguanylate cyclase (GGDEF)-like protein/PAS domain S-box-containing protein
MSRPSSSSSVASAAAPPPWWRRVHAALMPDYNRRAGALWWLLVLGGLVLMGWCVLWLSQQSGAVALQLVLGLLLAVGSGLFPLRLPGTKIAFAAGEIFIFLVLLILGAEAAAMVAAGEAFLGAWRTSKRWTSRLASPAICGLAMWACGTLLHLGLSALMAAGLGGAATLLAAAMGCSLGYFLANTVLVSGLMRWKRGAPFFQWLDMLSVFRWVGLAYATSASVATLLFIVYQQQGGAVLLVMVPLLAMFLLTLHFYFRQQEVTVALRAANLAGAEREAALEAEKTAQAAAHLQALQASERRFHSAFTHASIGMALLRLDGLILQANPALASLLGLPEAQLAQRPLPDFLLAEDRTALQKHLSGTPGDFRSFTQELRGQHVDGSTVWLAVHCSFFTDPELVAEAGMAQPCLILQAQDISARREAEAGLAHLAFHDPLTGLPNRRRFNECLVGAVARYQSDPKRPWAVMFLDFDRFKLVNDSLGHTAGDELLLQMARRVQEKLRPNDIVARLGGDEFAVLLNDIEHERDAIVLAERLMDALRQPFVLGTVELTASASIGITFSSLGYARAEDVLRDADTAMYKAKSQGKARYSIFDASLHTAVSARLRLEGELRGAIARGELSLAYQPLFALTPGSDGGSQLQGFEALVRWQHPQDGALLPAAFLGVAEESGQMLQLSDFVLHCACHQLRQWQQSDPRWAGLTMSVNLSAHDLSHPALVARVGRALVESGLRPEQLTLELTENILMSSIDGALSTLHALRALGARLAVDDFGTGYSSLSHLSRLPVDSLKIDRSFVVQLQRHSDDAAVVGAIIQLGAALRKGVVAEGIESADQMAQLVAMGCELGQGFHLAMPLSAAATTDWLRQQPAPFH